MDYPGNRRSDAIYPVKNTSDEVGCDTYFISYNRCVDLLDCNNYIIVHIVNIPMQMSTLFGNSEHPFPEKQCMSFRK